MVRLAPEFARLPLPADHPDRLDALGDEIARLAAHIHAATFRLLELIRDFDEHGGWSGGFRSCAHWLSWRCGVGLGTAREKVRVARALAELPAISDAMHSGEMSFSKIRAMTRVATPANEAELLEVARHATAAQLERIVRGWRRIDRAEEAEVDRARHARRSLEFWTDDDGGWVLRGRLEPEVGAVLVKALEAAVLELHGTSTDEPIDARRADALGLVAEAALGGGLTDGAASRADRFQVRLHVAAERDECRLDPGPRVSAETARRLACDASRVVFTEAADGTVLDIGRKTRTVPPAIRRALERRDGGCRLPGCSLRFCDAHHIVPWEDGGPTSLDNLVLICRRHHRLVHHDGWRVEIDGPDVRFYRPDGRKLPAVPPTPQPAAAGVADPAAFDPWTPTAQGVGERFDLDWILLTLREPRGVPVETYDGSGVASPDVGRAS